jgi:hypothetical protein
MATGAGAGVSRLLLELNYLWRRSWSLLALGIHPRFDWTEFWRKPEFESQPCGFGYGWGCRTAGVAMAEGAAEAAQRLQVRVRHFL